VLLLFLSLPGIRREEHARRVRSQAGVASFPNSVTTLHGSAPIGPTKKIREFYGLEAL
jgi:hypothetical protein